MIFVHQIFHALNMSFAMFWEILWALVLGFTLSAVVQAVVSKSAMVKLIPDDSPKSLAVACGLGAASSSCSYAAVALARSIFRKGANFTGAMAFQLASTNLVIELGIILIVLMGWQFMAAEFIGGLLMVAIMAFLFRIFLKPALLNEARMQADKGLLGVMEGHAEMDMSLGFTAISHYFIMDWAAIWKDILGGLLIAGALGAWVPISFWNNFFLNSHPALAKFWGPLIGPVVAVVSFVCSIGNVPLAAVLWNGGISFGGVLAFIYADLIILPILNIYRKYYGGRMSFFIFVTFFVSMALSALAVEFGFALFGLVPAARHAQVIEAHVSWNYTTLLNILFLALAVILIFRFLKTGGPAMLRMMNKPAESKGNAAYYTCPMHPKVRQNEPGQCPRCHMKLTQSYSS